MTSENFGIFRPRTTPRPRSDGERTRQAILRAAAQLATTRGLAGVSIGSLAEFTGMSKSGLFAHFGSKEELELATIETAVEVFASDVLARAANAGPGLARLMALVDAFLSHLERRVYPGGCFFAAVAAEVDTRPGKAHDRVKELQREWTGLHLQCLREAQEAGEIDAKADLPQVLFEVEAMLIAANFTFVMNADLQFLRLARRGIDNVLARVRPAGQPGAAKGAARAAFDGKTARSRASRRRGAAPKRES